MNINEVYQLMDKFETSSLSEFSLEMEGVKLSVKKGADNCTVAVTAPQIQTVTVPMEGKEDTAETKTITAPLVGTFYISPAPGEKPFVEKGQQVKKGDVVGIIEAMKLMNEITATEDGVVETIEVEDGSLVEYGQVLIRLS